MEFVALIVIIIFVIILQNQIYGKSGLKNVHYTCTFSKTEVYEGEEIELIEEIRNEKLLPVPWMKAELTVPKWLDFAATQSVITDKSRFVTSFFMLKSYHRVVRKWRVKCLKRGVFGVDTVVLVASDLLGNVSLSCPVKVNAQVTVLPDPFALNELSISSLHLMGDRIVKHQLLSDPFFIAGVREYQDGDALNKINWLATAKEKQIMVNQNDFTTSQSVTVILNIQSREYDTVHIAEEQPVENCIRVCASCIDCARQIGMPVRLLSNAPLNHTSEPAQSNEFTGDEHTLNLFRMLANLQLICSESFDSYLSGMYDNIASSDICIVTSFVNQKILNFAESKRHDGAFVKLFVLGAVPSGGDCEIYDMSGFFHKPDFILKSSAEVLAGS